MRWLFPSCSLRFESQLLTWTFERRVLRLAPWTINKAPKNTIFHAPDILKVGLLAKPQFLDRNETPVDRKSRYRWQGKCFSIGPKGPTSKCISPDTWDLYGANTWGHFWLNLFSIAKRNNSDFEIASFFSLSWIERNRFSKFQEKCSKTNWCRQNMLKIQLDEFIRWGWENSPWLR